MSDTLDEALRIHSPSAKLIVLLQAGDFHTGAFDDFPNLIPISHRHDAWVHVDGAFGLWAAASPIGQPTAVRAVARSCASNKTSIFIPRHRVIRGTGELGGYKWGLARKRALIDCERGQRDTCSDKELTSAGSRVRL